MSTTITLDRALSSTARVGYFSYGLPPQTVSVDEKNTDEWKRASMNFMVNEARSHSIQKARDLKKYKMLSSEYDYKDSHHAWALDPLNLGDEKDDLYGSTEDIQHYPIVNTPLNTILGERISRTTQWFCVSNAPESRNEYYRQKGDMLFDSVHAGIMNTMMKDIIGQAQANGIEITDEFIQKAQQQAEQQRPSSIQDYMDTGYSDVVEKVHNRIVKNIMRSNDLETEFIEGFRHGNLCGKEFYSFEVVNNKLKIKNLSPFSVFYYKSPSKRWISESQFAGYRLFLTPSSIIDSYRDKLNLEDVERLERRMNPSANGGGINSLTGIKSINYDTSVFSDWHGNTFDNINQPMIDGMINEFMMTGQRVQNRETFGLFEVVQAYWKSFRKIGILEVFLEGDTPLEQLVDENYVPDKNAGEHVKWFYLNQVYQGTCIADELLLDVGPYPFQIFDENDPDYCPLPIEGAEYNNYNGETMALMDLMMPWAELYDIVAAELKKDLKKSIGNAMVMSIDNIPDIEGFDENKWMYWLKEFGIAWVGAGKKNSSFSHYQSFDMSMMNSITIKMQLLDKIKMNCDGFGGFSQPRVAGTSSSPTQGQDQQKLIASANQTEYYFWKNNKICERVITYGLNITKILLRRKKDLSVLYDDMEQRYIDEGELDKAIACNVGIYVINSSQEINKREALRQMAAAAAGKTGQAEDMADIILADTQNEVKKVLRSIQRKTSEQQQRDFQLQQQQIQAEQQQSDKDRQWEEEKHYSKLESDERREYIKSFGNNRNVSPDQDTDSDGIPDPLEYDTHFEQVNDNMRKHQREMRKIDNDSKLKDKQLALEGKKIDVEKDRNAIARENMKNDVQVAKINSQNRGKTK